MLGGVIAAAPGRSPVVVKGAALCCSAGASPWRGFSSWGARALGSRTR